MGRPRATDWLRFLGMNIKGTPSMSAKRVEHDLRQGTRLSDVIVVQEFRWPWYWRVARNLLQPRKWETRWCSSPAFRWGFKAPVRGAQAVMWRASVWKRKRTRRALLHRGFRKISEMRFLRAVRLKHRETGLHCWYGTTHFVVKGDESHDTAKRRGILASDLRAFDRFLRRLRRTGHPVIFQLDANIHRRAMAYDEFDRILDKHGATLHGEHGVEYLLTIPGRRVDVVVEGDWIISTRRLETDHEGRGINYRLVHKH